MLKKLLATTGLLLGLLVSCTSPFGGVDASQDASHRAASSQVVSGPNGSVTVSGMADGKLTVSYTNPEAIKWAKLYVTEGNGLGLVLASQPMAAANGVYSYTLNHATFKEGAKIGLVVLVNKADVETCVPQGRLADAGSWASFNYRSGSEDTVTVSYDSQAADVPASPSSQTITKGSSVGTLPAAPQKAGSSFGGWFTEPNGAGSQFGAATAVAANLTVYAKWNSSGGDLVLSGANGSIAIADMAAGALTVKYTPGRTIPWARLYLSQGNGSGLVLAARDLANAAGTWSYSFSHPSFITGAKIFVTVLTLDDKNLEICVPQGRLSAVDSWASFTYASSNQVSVSYDSQGATTPANPAVQTIAKGSSVGSLPSPPVKLGSEFGGWYTAPQGGGSRFEATTRVDASLTVYAKWTGGGDPSDLGPNVILIDPSMSSAAIQAKLTDIYQGSHQMQSGQFSSDRFAVLFKPGSYNINVYVGFYTQVAGLGQHPDDVQITGTVQADGQWFRSQSTHNAPDVLCNFWRMVENLAVTPTTTINNDPATMLWGVSQSSPMRRVHVKGGLDLWDTDGWASGGFMADSRVDGALKSGAQQQWLYRNNAWTAAPIGGVWDMVFVGNSSAPATAWPTNPNSQHIISLPTTPTVIREKPYLYLDQGGNYAVFVPALRPAGSVGTTWTTSGGKTAGVSLPLSRFFVAKPSDSAATINAMLASGKHLLFTPGIYQLNDTLRVNNPDTVVLGIGLATLVNSTGLPAMQVGDADGVIIAGLLFDAGPVMASHQLEVGSSGAGHAANPIFLFDLFFRVGGAQAGNVDTSLQINASNVVGDNFWIWRGDHGNGVGWNTNRGKTGIKVNGNDVTVYGLAVEHYQEYQTIWNGSGGKVYFYQSECPYDVPDQASWMNGGVKGFASYKVNAADHSAYGVGIYNYFNVNPSVQLENAIEVPAGMENGQMFHYMGTVGLSSLVNGGVGQINHVINGKGSATINVNSACFITE